MGLAKVELEPHLAREIQHKVLVSLALLMTEGLDQPVVEIKWNHNSQSRQGLCHGFCVQVEDPWHNVQIKWEECELEFWSCPATQPENSGIWN